MSNSQKTNGRDAMSLLSTYMLQGWVMTDGQCQVANCSVPIMRSRDGSIQFCVVHDPLPTGSAQSSQKQQQQQAPPCAPSSPPLLPQAEQERPTPAVRAEELSTNKTTEARLRREQSSRASKLIGEKLLQRWALLNDICPSPACYAIPLMRDLNKHVVCVICGQRYLTEEQAAAVAAAAPATVPIPTSQDLKVPVPSATEKEPVAQSVTKHHRQHQRHQQRVQSVSGKTTGTAAYSAFADAISQKLYVLTDRMTVCQDPAELKQLFEAIKAGALALHECEQLSK